MCGVAVGIVVFTLLSVYSGLAIYAKYHECDPVISRVIRKHDQVVPFAVMDFALSIPGFPGLFIAGVFSAALR
jgi:solute carrier family 5 (sodium-coupled monocarboxylate transporter), member 8/12